MQKTLPPSSQPGFAKALYSYQLQLVKMVLVMIPYFILPDYQCTAAQLPAKIKNTISHRAQALNQLRDFIQKLIMK